MHETAFELIEIPHVRQFGKNSADIRMVVDALDLIMETLEALAEERGAEDKVWGSMVKQALTRRRPGFNESYYGYRSFNRLPDEAADRGLIELELDKKSGGCIVIHSRSE